jgi:hypothetical protein
MIGAIAVTGIDRNPKTMGAAASAKLRLIENATASDVASVTLAHKPRAADESV